MLSYRSQRCGFAAILLLAACARDALAPRLSAPEAVALAKKDGLPAIVVDNRDELYEAVNNVANVGRVIELEPLVYVLDPTKDFGGRLQLQENMSLRGRPGHAEDVVIDASALDAGDLTDGMLTAPIRVGRGSNAVEWLTVVGAGAGAAGIETDLVGISPANIRISHVIIIGNVRGIDVRNFGSGMANRVLTVELTDNHFLDHVGLGQGIRFINTNGATNASIVATLRNNESTGNVAGCLAANLNTSDASITIDSHGDDFSGNGNGCVFLTGNATMAGSANRNTVTFRAHASRFEDNGAPIPAAFDAGGILAVGGLSAVAGRANDNTLTIELWGVKFNGNVEPDLAVFGAQSTGVSPAGNGNSVTITLHGVSKQATDETVASFPGPAGTNTAIVTR